MIITTGNNYHSYFWTVCIESSPFPFYVIGQKQEILHATFSFTRHQTALFWLQKNSYTKVDPPKKNKNCIFIELFLAGKKKSLQVPSLSLFLDKGTLFQKKVWQLISTIPYGQTATYGSLSKKLGSKSYARAVGNACNANPLALLIPCHRVVKINGPGGYAGGPEIKEWLLRLEKG